MRGAATRDQSLRLDRRADGDRTSLYAHVTGPSGHGYGDRQIKAAGMLPMESMAAS